MTRWAGTTATVELTGETALLALLAARYGSETLPELLTRLIVAEAERISLPVLSATYRDLKEEAHD